MNVESNNLSSVKMNNVILAMLCQKDHFLLEHTVAFLFCFFSALCQDIPDPAGAWIHAFLHREEGDLGNASYWYHRAGKEMPSQNVTLDQEWGQIAAALS